MLKVMTLEQKQALMALCERQTNSHSEMVGEKYCRLWRQQPRLQGI